MAAFSPALSDYASSFQYRDENFLTFYDIGPQKELVPWALTRGEFWDRACVAAQTLASFGVAQGDYVVHYFSDNAAEDLILRLASIMLGCVPVTVNWQADSPARVLYKIKVTGAKVVVVDVGVSDSIIETLNSSNARVMRAEELVPRIVDLGSLPAAPVWASDLTQDADRIVIFTSGTTGEPKGVRLSFRAYECNAKTFDVLLNLAPEHNLLTFIVNPLHHTNSTAISDWAMRRRGSHLHLCRRYTTAVWPALAKLAAACAESTWRIVAPLVSKHVDFLSALTAGAAPATAEFNQEALLAALSSPHVFLLLGSAPVGPSTVAAVQHLSGGRLPIVRFGSTETCLQVLGTAAGMGEDIRLRAFQRGWAHFLPVAVDASNAEPKQVPQPGYYVGRETPSLTEVRVVASVDPCSSAFLQETPEGVPGLLVCRGANLFTAYASAIESAALSSVDGRLGAVLEGWYVGLGDVCFWLLNQEDGGKDIYWVSRDSALLIKGGANYSYEQINDDLSEVLASSYQLTPGVDFIVGVIGIRQRSEHDDDACVTIELLPPGVQRLLRSVGDLTAEGIERTESAPKGTVGLIRGHIRSTFLSECRKRVSSKTSIPDAFRFGAVSRNFKGAVLVKELTAAWKERGGNDDDI